jgi:hypothetical protein
VGIGDDAIAPGGEQELPGASVIDPVNLTQSGEKPAPSLPNLPESCLEDTGLSRSRIGGSSKDGIHAIEIASGLDSEVDDKVLSQIQEKAINEGDSNELPPVYQWTMVSTYQPTIEDITFEDTSQPIVRGTRFL